MFLTTFLTFNKSKHTHTHTNTLYSYDCVYNATVFCCCHSLFHDDYEWRRRLILYMKKVIEKRKFQIIFIFFFWLNPFYFKSKSMNKSAQLFFWTNIVRTNVCEMIRLRKWNVCFDCFKLFTHTHHINHSYSKSQAMTMRRLRAHYSSSQSMSSSHV